MNAKQIQVKHWQNCEHPCPHKTTLEMFWHRAGIKIPDDDETAIRAFRLEVGCINGDNRYRFNRRFRNDNYALAA